MKRIIMLFAIFSMLLYAEGNSADDKLTIQPYGFYKFDMSYDSDLMSAGNFARWALPNSDESIPTTNITAKQSRFGMNIKKGAMSGKVEIDFYGVGSAENKGGVLLRKAYAQAHFDNFTLRAGQDSDVMSPLVPSTINYPVAWWAGNIGYRRPMLKLFGNSDILDWAVAITRNIGGDISDGYDLPTDGLDDGSVGILPELQGRLGFTLMDNYKVGFSGHFAQRDIGNVAEDGKYNSWSANVDANLQITPKINLSGEFFTGSNMASHLGGIANPSTFEGVETQGGWVNLKVKPNAKLSLSTGFSMDDPCECDLVPGQRSKNTMFFANFYQDILQGFLVGFEVSQWTTEYKDMDTASAVRGQVGFIYKF